MNTNAEQSNDDQIISGTGADLGGKLCRRVERQHDAEHGGKDANAGHKPRTEHAAWHLEATRTVRLLVTQAQERDEHEHVVGEVQDRDRLRDEGDEAFDVRRRNTMNAMIVMSAICMYIRRLGMPCLLLFCRNFGRKPERPAWPSM